MKDKTLLSDFIERHLKDYVEPERRGVPKGMPIGLSKVKYHAALLRLTRNKLKDTAEALGISYMVMRKWNIETQFKKKVKELASEFAGEIVDFFLNENSSLFGRYEEVCDCGHYSDIVITEFIKKLSEAIKAGRFNFYTHSFPGWLDPDPELYENLIDFKLRVISQAQDAALNTTDPDLRRALLDTARVANLILPWQK